MSLFNLIDWAATKAYNKHKESKLEEAMDTLIDSLESTALNLEVLPYDTGKKDYTIRGKVYKLNKEELSKSSANYFLTIPSWLSKSGIDTNSDIYDEALKTKGGYLFLNLIKKYPNLVQNYNKIYNSLKVKTSLFIFSPEEGIVISMPKYISVKNKENTNQSSLVLSKQAGISDVKAIVEEFKTNNDNKERLFSNYYTLAKVFAYEVAKELYSYNKDNLENAFKIFQEKHGPNSEIKYSF